MFFDDLLCLLTVLDEKRELPLPQIDVRVRSRQEDRNASESRERFTAALACDGGRQSVERGPALRAARFSENPPVQAGLESLPSHS